MRSLTWIDPDGGELSLNLGSTDGVVAAPGVQVAGMPPVRTVTDAVPLSSGTRWRYVDYGPREVNVPVCVMGDDSAAVEEAVDALLYAFSPTRGDGRLRVSRSDGSTRDLTCRYVGSLVFAEQHAAQDVWQGVLTLLAADPFYSDTADSAFTVTPGTVPTFFPLFPLRLGSSEISNAFGIENLGQVDAWPVWTLTGPLTGVEVVNATTGESFALTSSVAAGDTLTIDTRPGRKVITTGDGDEVFPITGDSSLFSLAPGTNAITITFTGSDVGSSIEVRWRNRWLSA